MTQFSEQFPNSGVQQLVKQFGETRSMAETPCSSLPTVLTDDKLDEMPAKMIHSISKFTHRLLQKTHVAISTACKAMHDKLKLYPYTISAICELKPMNNAKRLQHCEWFNTLQQKKGKDILDDIFTTAKA